MINLIAEAVLPIAWVLAMGFVLKRYATLDEALWRGLEWLSYWVFMPSLLISVIVSAPSLEVPWGALLGSLYGTLLVLTGVLLLAWYLGWLGASYSQFTSVYQGVTRFNTFIALAVIAGLNDALVPHLGIAATVFIVLLNIFCICIMTAGSRNHIIKSVWTEFLRNPLIIGCLLGGFLRLCGVPAQFPISGLVLLGQAALPIGILCLGAGIRWHAIRNGLALNAVTLIGIFLVKPVLYVTLATVLGLSSDWLLVGLLLMSVSTAPSSFILAKQLGGDAELMAGIVATQTLMSIVTLPLTLWFFDFWGWITLV